MIAMDFVADQRVQLHQGKNQRQKGCGAADPFEGAAQGTPSTPGLDGSAVGTNARQGVNRLATADSHPPG
jgi:hypothetical protein